MNYTGQWSRTYLKWRVHASKAFSVTLFWVFIVPFECTPTFCHCADPEGLQPGVLPSAFPGHTVDSGWSLSPRCGTSPVPAGPLLSLRSLQAGQIRRHRGRCSQSVLRHVVLVGCSAQQWHWGRYGKDITSRPTLLLKIVSQWLYKKYKNNDYHTRLHFSR